MVTEPQVSVILPVYNGGEYLKESVMSVLNQSLQQFEFLILEDCSTDESYLYLESLNDPRITVYRNDMNRGLFFNLNFLISRSTSGLIKLWSQDDRMYEHCLESFVSFHQRHQFLGYSYCSTDKIDQDGNLKPAHGEDRTPEIIPASLHAMISYYTGSLPGNIANVCITKTAFNRTGIFNESMKFSADFDMWIRIAENYETGFINKKLVQLRDHEGQLSRKNDLLLFNLKEDLEIYRYLDNYVTPKERAAGLTIMRNFKLPFYYTTMLKALARGKLREAGIYFRELSAYDNFIKLSLAYLRNKILPPPKPDFSGIKIAGGSAN